MNIPKGYRAREAAGRQRKVRGRIDPDIRAQRQAVLEPKIHKAILRTRDQHELKAVFEAEEKAAAEKSVSETVQPVQPVEAEQTEQVVSDEQFAELVDADEDEQPADEQSEPEKSTEEEPVEAKPEQAASKPKSKSKNKNK
ncbi:hypothetical protein [Bradyrhizobium erythrophlei]|uniref:Uncharacterized protein n=1 Tax=Bradyrhizobium erythrophlei TaxID=1437360 RepID=A0A1M5PWU1_9BRAD|nr:hypothetical protein [Bradyrhizobium erythrophlei]SHH06156.1 hypothetical protein SAMN05443248_3541 [Bradyrhizobium erythrophlei]